MSAPSDGDSAGPRSGPFIAAAIAGQHEGERFLRRLDCCSDPDALYHALINAFVAGDAGQPKLRGFARALQKAAERAA